MREIAFEFLLIFAFVVIVPFLTTVSGEPCEVWESRRRAAEVAANEAYRKDPINVINSFNDRLYRHLTETKGDCAQMNPIDACWRCKPDWAQNRQKLADCVMGFAHGTTGGKGGQIYVVKDSSDTDLVNPKPGTLRHAVIQKEPLWITFERDMEIKPSQELIIASDKTIDGRGANVRICNGAQITLQNVKNVIIHGIHIQDINVGQGGVIRDSIDHFGKRGPSDGDGITVFGSTNVWIDHVSFSNTKDGLVDVLQGSTAVTISNCHFTKHDKAVLLGAQDTFTEDKKMQATVAFNRFGPELTQRMPRVRNGFAHIVNNDYIQWKMYAIGGSSGPTIISEGNRFEAPADPNKKKVTKRDAEESVWKTWTWRSHADLLLNGAIFEQSGQPLDVAGKPNMIKPSPGESVPLLTKSAGALSCKEGAPC